MEHDDFSLFLQFNDAVPGLEGYSEKNRLWIKDLQSQVAKLSPVEIDALCRKMLDGIVVNQPLIRLYEELHSFQIETMGSGWWRSDGQHPLTDKTVELLRQTMNTKQPTSTDMEAFIKIVEEELEKNSRAFFLRQILNRNADTAIHHRLQKLEEMAGAMRESVSSPLISPNKSSAEFTQVRQALALRYLFNEVLGLTNIDNTRLIALGHLLSAKPIPLDEQTGAWKIANSGLKSAFTKSVRKDGRGYIADLEFILRVFIPLGGQGATPIGNAIAALQKDIDREKKKLAREKD